MTGELGETVEIPISTLAAGGDGVGRTGDGRVVFVPRTAPGDRVRVSVVEAHRRYLRGEMVELLEAGPDRVEPRCALFGEAGCGGCQWQHLSSAAQQKAKQELVRSALRRAVAAGMDLLPLRGAVPAFGWRRRARLHWARRRRADRVVLGFFRHRSNRIVDVETCPQLAVELDGAIAEVRAQRAAHLFGRGEVAAVAGRSGDVHLAFHGAVRGDLQPLVGRGPIAGLTAGRKRCGVDAVELEEGIWASAGDFAQASAAGNRELRSAVEAALAAAGPRRALELYAGGGNLTRSLVEAGAEVTAVEGSRAPVEEDRLPGSGGRVVWRRGESVEDALDVFVEAGESFDLCLLDPPRTGAKRAIDQLARLRPPHLVLVSCDPATAGRDVGILMERGYQPVEARPVDLMPQTAHVEVVVSLRCDDS